MKLRKYLDLKQITVSDAASQLSVTPQRVYQLLNGDLPGAKLTLKIVEWSEGAVRTDDLLFPKNSVA